MMTYLFTSQLHNRIHNLISMTVNIIENQLGIYIYE